MAAVWYPAALTAVASVWSAGSALSNCLSWIGQSPGCWPSSSDLWAGAHTGDPV